jgi:hypothetical protein
MNVNAIIQEILDNIENKSNNDKIKETYAIKYPLFKQNYPTLFEKLFDPTIDKKMLNLMLEEKKNIDSNEISQHNASVKIGEVLVDKYVKPMLSEGGD